MWVETERAPRIFGFHPPSDSRDPTGWGLGEIQNMGFAVVQVSLSCT